MRCNDEVGLKKLQRGKILARVYFLIVVLMLGFDAFSGPIRYYLFSYGLELFSYLPKALALAFFCVSLMLCRHHISVFRILAFIAASLCISTFYGNNSNQILFGVFIIAPLLFGLTTPYLNSANIRAMYVFIFFVWIVSVCGIWVDVFFTFPWEGAEASINGKVVEVSRAWSTYAIDRPAGFAKLSVAAAFYSSIFGIFIIGKIRGFFPKMCVYTICLATVAVTTNKAALAGLILLPMLVYLRNKSKLFTTFVSLIAIISLSLPLTTIFIEYRLNLQDYYSLFIFSSFEQRLVTTWPIYISKMGFQVFGAGLGGVGSAVGQFGVGEAQKYLAVSDSLPLYLIGWLGPLFGPLALVVFAAKSIRLVRGSDFEKILGFIGIFVIIAGINTDMTEGVLTAYFIGIILKTSFSNKLA